MNGDSHEEGRDECKFLEEGRTASVCLEQSRAGQGWLCVTGTGENLQCSVCLEKGVVPGVRGGVS